MSKRPWHVSGKLHVTGQSRFIGESLQRKDMLHAAFVYSPVAHACLTNLKDNIDADLRPQIILITASDIPGENQIGHVLRDEPLFPDNEIMYVGQPLAMLLAPTPQLARLAASQIEVEYDELTAILEVFEADEKEQWYMSERRIESGDVQTALSRARHRLEGSFFTEGQEHFYLETQRCVAIPGEDGQLTLHAATQSTMEVQEVVSHVLGIPAHKIVVDVMRLGGAFGGKERGGTIWACLAALGAHLTGKPVSLILDRVEDMQASGKRHPYFSYYDVGFDAQGRISAYDLLLLANGGAYVDLSIAVLERAMFHADNAYHIPHARIRGRACRTNLPPNTAFRGFGAPQGIFVIEHIMDRIARYLGKDILQVREINYYKPDDHAPYGQEIKESSLLFLTHKLKHQAKYYTLKDQVDRVNSHNMYKRQGLGFVPVKFGISFTTAFLNQGSALIWIYIDGTVSVTTGGIEMGQEVNTKVALIVSHVLGIPFDRIKVESSNSQRVGNASPTAASTGSDINGNAARLAAEQLRDRLSAFAAQILSQLSNSPLSAQDITLADDYAIYTAKPEIRMPLTDLVRLAHLNRIALGAHGYYATPGVHFDRSTGKGNPFAYYVYGCALVRAEVDLLSGETKVLDCFIVHETAPSLHEDIDRGQIIGAFVQSMGWCTIEEMLFDDYGRYTALTPSTYKIPSIRDIPANLHIDMVQTPCTEASVLGSKAVGEPPFIYGEAVWLAIRNALNTLSTKNEVVDLDFPATPEAVLLAYEAIKVANRSKPKSEQQG